MHSHRRKLATVKSRGANQNAEHCPWAFLKFHFIYFYFCYIYPFPRQIQNKMEQNFIRILWLQKCQEGNTLTEIKIPNCNRKRSPSFQRATIVIVEALRFGYWHLGSICEEKQNKHRVPRAFPIGSPKCGWYRGLSAPQSPGRRGKGQVGAS